jgi:hypothetical protein
MKRCLLSAACSAVLFCAFLAAAARCDDAPLQTFTSAKYRFSVSYPASFQAVSSDEPLVALLLRSTGGNYPTFNVLIQPGPFDARERSASELIRRIEQSYHEVGITDATAEGGEALMLAQRPAFRARVSFVRGDLPLRAEVVLVSGEEHHFILTFVDTAAAFEAHDAMFRDITASFSLPPQENQVPPARPSAPAGWMIAAGFMGVAAVMVLAARYLRRKRTTHFS